MLLFLFTFASKVPRLMYYPRYISWWHDSPHLQVWVIRMKVSWSVFLLGCARWRSWCFRGLLLPGQHKPLSRSSHPVARKQRVPSLRFFVISFPTFSLFPCGIFWSALFATVVHISCAPGDIIFEKRFSTTWRYPGAIILLSDKLRHKKRDQTNNKKKNYSNQQKYSTRETRAPSHHVLLVIIRLARCLPGTGLSSQMARPRYYCAHHTAYSSHVTKQHSKQWRKSYTLHF